MSAREVVISVASVKRLKINGSMAIGRNVQKVQRRAERVAAAPDDIPEIITIVAVCRSKAPSGKRKIPAAPQTIETKIVMEKDSFSQNLISVMPGLTR